MALSRHINSDELMNAARGVRRTVREKMSTHSLAYGSRYATAEIPKWELPKHSSEPRTAYQLVHDELELDGRPALNLASFVHTWMEPEADKLVMENINKNLSDQDEYPQTMVIHGRCISILGNLWKIPKGQNAVGTATVGSSEAIMLGGLALKKRWQARQKAAGKDASKPNIIMGHNAQVALEKFARYFDVECRLVPVSKESAYCLDIHKAIELVDENTIGVFVILGSTYTGHFEDVEGLSKLLDDYEAKTGISVPIHVDAASGGFVAPFAFPHLKWAFDLPRVHSINTSGHKFGLAYPGIGWVLWRGQEYLPKELVFELHYLGGTELSYGLNFSRPACFMIAQYYNFIRLGWEGYTNITNNDLENARLLCRALEKTGYYEVVSDVHRPVGVRLYNAKTAMAGQVEPHGMVGKVLHKTENYTPSLPVVSFKFTEEFKKQYPHVQQALVSGLLRTKGWIVPNYPLPPNEDATEILRVVVRESMTEDLIDMFMSDIIWYTEVSINSSGIEAEMFKRTNDALETYKPDVDHTTAHKPGTYAKQC
ncbi:hypothetical protein BZG36_00278 [Bifiguratus adelaidae]|uniref:Glutamate decarboxylase n=1 Tax=Bifiguratus adelaidae TaxID=1938954 RepID=A0A261Y7Q2_9FUNG|nr:hypothetical protein BZG36_00278 [Bifiguratus adelaidae]